MSVGDTIRKNLDFWHWYPQLICEGLTEEQLHWQPEAHPNHMMFAMWHAYRSEDDIIHGVLMGRAPVFVTEGWAERRRRLTTTARKSFLGLWQFRHQLRITV